MKKEKKTTVFTAYKTLST
uniref:Uncharacterized protein n=1 Tax=Rhizophora mucronata TaxID=61149 RepID=A0A2P2P6Q6_RHIMU